MPAEIFLADLFNDFYAFIAIMITAAGALGALGGRSMALGAFAAYLVFVQYAIEVGDELLTQILYVTLVLVFVGMAFKLWRLELAGTGGVS